MNSLADLFFTTFLQIKSLWDFFSFPVSAWLCFWALRTFDFRFSKRWQMPIILITGFLCGQCVNITDRLLKLLGIVPTSLLYLYISMTSIVFILVGSMVLYRGDKALISLSSLLVYNFFSALRFCFIGILQSFIPQQHGFSIISLSLVPTILCMIPLLHWVVQFRRIVLSGLSQKESIAWFGIALIAMILMCISADFTLNWWQIIINATFLMLTNGAVYYLVFSYARERFVTAEQQKILLNMEKNGAYLEQMKELDAHISMARHEIRNHIFYIDQLVHEQDFDALDAYLNKLKASDISTTRLVSCGHPIIDAIVNVKSSYAHSIGINMSADIFLPETVAIERLPLCSVLANLLNNAIEGSTDIPDAQIKLEIYLHKEYLIITVSNTVSCNILKENPHLLTTKKDADRHGIGLKVVEQIAHWYEGDLRLEMADEHTFCTSVMLRNRSMPMKHQ